MKPIRLAAAMATAGALLALPVDRVARAARGQAPTSATPLAADAAFQK